MAFPQFSPKTPHGYFEAFCHSAAQSGVAVGVSERRELAGGTSLRDKQRSFSMVGTGRIAGTAKRQREAQRKSDSRYIRKGAGIFNAGAARLAPQGRGVTRKRSSPEVIPGGHPRRSSPEVIPGGHPRGFFPGVFPGGFSRGFFSEVSPEASPEGFPRRPPTYSKAVCRGAARSGIAGGMSGEGWQGERLRGTSKGHSAWWGQGGSPARRSGREKQDAKSAGRYKEGGRHF